MVWFVCQQVWHMFKLFRHLKGVLLARWGCWYLMGQQLNEWPVPVLQHWCPSLVIAWNSLAMPSGGASWCYNITCTATDWSAVIPIALWDYTCDPFSQGGVMESCGPASGYRMNDFCFNCWKMTYVSVLWWTLAVVVHQISQQLWNHSASAQKCLTALGAMLPTWCCTT